MRACVSSVSLSGQRSASGPPWWRTVVNDVLHSTPLGSGTVVSMFTAARLALATTVVGAADAAPLFAPPPPKLAVRKSPSFLHHASIRLT